MTPVGGGGLISGTALSAYYLSPNTKVVGAEPSNKGDGYNSLKKNMHLPNVNFIYSELISNYL
jgi:threonine dehydratase